MKRYLLATIAALTGLTVCAQTNTPARPSTLRDLTRISSDSGDFDLAGHEATYHATYLGHVRVDDPQMKLTCEQLTADVPRASGRPNRIVAETNVVIDFTERKRPDQSCDRRQGGLRLFGTERRDQRDGDADRQSAAADGKCAGHTGRRRYHLDRVNGDIHVSLRGNYHASLRAKTSAKS